MVSTRQPTRNPDIRVCARDYAMGAPLTPISPRLRHRPPNSLCRSVARNNQFPCEGNEIVGKGGGRGGEGNEGGRQNWCSRQSVVGGFFRFFAHRIFCWNFWEQKKLRGTLLLDPLLTLPIPGYVATCHFGGCSHLDLIGSGFLVCSLHASGRCDKKMILE